MKSLNPEITELIRIDWQSAPFGHKTGVIKRWADKIGCSEQTLYRQIETGRKRTGERKIKDIETYVLAVAHIKKKPPASLGEISTDQAIDIAVGNGLIPETNEI